MEKVDATSKKKSFLRPRCKIAVKKVIHKTNKENRGASVKCRDNPFRLY